MANIVLIHRFDKDKQGRRMPSYAWSFHKALVDLDHNVQSVGEGFPENHVSVLGDKIKQYDLLIDLDCGRNNDGKLHFQYYDEKCPIPSAVRFIDTHGFPSLHRRLAKNYQHVFFAVWRLRDLFSPHPSAFWCPNASDAKWFDYLHYDKFWNRPTSTIGFFGTRGGLDRADILRNVCARYPNYRAIVKEVGARNRGRWPKTAQEMALCQILFNKGQKHDGPNQRVFESMLINRPLITDRDPEDGMKKLFKEGEHFLGWASESELGQQIKWCLDRENGELAKSMALRAYKLVKEKHQVKNRVEQILEVALNG